LGDGNISDADIDGVFFTGYIDFISKTERQRRSCFIGQQGEGEN
jgi:hypothetical protein